MLELPRYAVADRGRKWLLVAIVAAIIITGSAPAIVNLFLR